MLDLTVAMFGKGEEAGPVERDSMFVDNEELDRKG
jgi:hypothetical protein